MNEYLPQLIGALAAIVGWLLFISMKYLRARRSEDREARDVAAYNARYQVAQDVYSGNYQKALDAYLAKRPL